MNCEIRAGYHAIVETAQATIQELTRHWHYYTAIALSLLCLAGCNDSSNFESRGSIVGQNVTIEEDTFAWTTTEQNKLCVLVPGNYYVSLVTHARPDNPSLLKLSPQDDTSDNYTLTGTDPTPCHGGGFVYPETVFTN